jgi:hypothetical protein
LPRRHSAWNADLQSTDAQVESGNIQLQPADAKPVAPETFPQTRRRLFAVGAGRISSGFGLLFSPGFG